MFEEYIFVNESENINGHINVSGAKNATLVIMASSLLIENGTLKLNNVPYSQDVYSMAHILMELGAHIYFDQKNSSLEIDTRTIHKFKVNPEVMRKFRASILIMGPLLTRFGKAQVSAPGGCKIGKRPINFHIDNFKKMNVEFQEENGILNASVKKMLPKRLVLEYPSVGATENLMMAATLIEGKTTIINAALEPEVLDLIEVLKKMGAKINISSSSTIEIEGVGSLNSVEHTIMPDRLEAGSLLLAAAVTGGDIFIQNANANDLDVFLLKLEEMGHTIIIGDDGKTGIRLVSTKYPKSVSFKTAQYPCFPTDLQAPMMVAQCLSEGISEIEETVFEDRLQIQINELLKMGANIKLEGNRAIVKGVEKLIGTNLVAGDIRSSFALVLAGLVAKGKTVINGVHHFKRGYDGIDKKLIQLGAKIFIDRYDPIMEINYKPAEI